MEHPRRVRVGLGDRAYDVAIGPGLLDRAGALLAPHMPRKRTAIVTDANVACHHGERLAAALERLGPVGIGCALAFRLSAELGFCSPEDAQRAECAVAKAGLPTRLHALAGAPFMAERQLDHMQQDKKAEGGKLVFVLARAIGDAFVAKDVDREAVLRFLMAEGAKA